LDTSGADDGALVVATDEPFTAARPCTARGRWVDPEIWWRRQWGERPNGPAHLRATVRVHVRPFGARARASMASLPRWRRVREQRNRNRMLLDRTRVRGCVCKRTLPCRVGDQQAWTPSAVLRRGVWPAIS